MDERGTGQRGTRSRRLPR